MQLSEAADMLGVHYQTAYAWVRQETLPARKTPRGYEVIESNVCALAARRAASREPPREVRVRDWGAQADRLYTALVAGDETQARYDLGRLAADLPVADVIRLAAGTAAGLIVLSSATARAVRLARQEAREIREQLPRRACPDRPSRRHARPVARARPGGHPCRSPRFSGAARRVERG
ncbi:MAG TPA: helix-turn-helix domain-containing protein [Trebonia sp.]|jgi:hypothetical protein